MKQLEILELAMEALIQKKRQKGISEQVRKEVEIKLKTVAYMFVLEEQKESKQDTYIGQSLKRLREASRRV